MTRRTVALVLAVALPLGFLPTATFAAAPGGLAAYHGGGSPCPDGDDGEACDPSCPCACCPGHAPAVFLGLAASSAALLQAASLRPPPTEDRPQDEFARGVFHPPRS